MVCWTDKSFFGWPWFPDSLTGFFLLGLWCGSASFGLIFIASVICVSRTINSSVCVPGLVSETVGWIPLRSQICGQIFHIRLSAGINQGDMAWKLPCQSFWVRMVFTKPTGPSGDSWVLNTETDWSEHICALLGRSGPPGHLSLVKAVIRILLARSGLPLESFPSFSNFSTTLKPPQVSKRSESPQLVPSVLLPPWAFLVWIFVFSKMDMEVCPCFTF